MDAPSTMIKAALLATQDYSSATLFVDYLTVDNYQDLPVQSVKMDSN
jgi:hypothetical protein